MNSALPKLKDTLLPARPDEVLEDDEAWRFVLKKDQQTLALDCYVQKNAANHCFFDWRPERKDLSTVMEVSSRGLSWVCFL